MPKVIRGKEWFGLSSVREGTWQGYLGKGDPDELIRAAGVSCSEL